MLTFEEKQQLMALLPEFELLSGFSDAASLRDRGAIEAQTDAEVLAAHELGLNRRAIFYGVPNKENLGNLLDKCRLVANSMEDLIRINEAAAAAGVITMVGLRLGADGFSNSSGLGITTTQLRTMVHDIKQLKFISVCGCIIVGDIDGLHGKELGKYVRSSYQTAKNMTYILPCSMPYICISNLLEAVARNRDEHPETFEDLLTAANIVGMQNSTAFYADYYIQ